jgi:hypothetical protein
MFAILAIFFITTNNCMKQEELPSKVETSLPEKLIITPSVFLEEMDDITEWICSGGTFETTTSQVKSGAGSIKCTSAVGTTFRLKKNVTWNFSSDNGNTFKICVYPHTAPVTTFNSIYIYLGHDATLTDYYTLYISAIKLVQNQWNLLSINTVNIPGGLWSITGTPNWNDINAIQISVKTVTGQTSICSFDLIENNAVNKPAAVLCFDDGQLSTYTKAYPYMKSKSMVGTAYAIADEIGLYPTVMTSIQLIEMYNDGWDTNHTNTHTVLTTLTQAQVETELTVCKGVLDGLGLTRASSHVAYPGGAANATTEKLEGEAV